MMFLLMVFILVLHDNVDWDPDGEPFRSDEQVQVGQPWSDPAGTPEDPLYGYSN